MLGWLLLIMLVVVMGGAAALGVSQSPTNVPLAQAINNTMAASSYSEVIYETTPEGSQTDYLTYHAPNRLGGYVESGNKRTYVYVIGNEEYQSLTVSSASGDKHLTFYRETTEGTAELDPARNYFRYAALAKNATHSGGTTTFKLTQSGQTGTFTFTVSGSYVSSMSLAVKDSSVKLIISQVNSAPPVELPPGAKVVTSQSGLGS
jgi:hypothetical protein